MPRVTFVGAGSAVFARQLVTDILTVDGLDEGVLFSSTSVKPGSSSLAA